MLPNDSQRISIICLYNLLSLNLDLKYNRIEPISARKAIPDGISGNSTAELDRFGRGFVSREDFAENRLNLTRGIPQSSVVSLKIAGKDCRIVILTQSVNPPKTRSDIYDVSKKQHNRGVLPSTMFPKINISRRSFYDMR